MNFLNRMYCGDMVQEQNKVTSYKLQDPTRAHIDAVLENCQEEEW